MPDPAYPRDLHGYGEFPPDPQWPGGARIAVNFVLNFEEGGENNVLHGDAASEHFLSDVIGAAPWPGMRHPSIESMFEYGSRAGVWRLLRLFERYGISLTVFAVGMAVERSPHIVARMAELGHEICSHGYRWIDYQHVDEETERGHVRLAVEAIRAAVGQRPLGWYTGRSGPNTRRLVAEEGGFLYESDAYDDDLPYWTDVDGYPLLIVPYTLDANDMRFTSPANFSSGDDFFTYLRDTFDFLYEEGARQPKMMTVGLHARLVGRPGRAHALERFLRHAASRERVWFATRLRIAEHWAALHPYEERS